MLGFLKSKQHKIADGVAEVLQPALWLIKSNNGGIAPEEKIANDPFLIGYVLGAFSFGLLVAGIGDDVGRLHTGSLLLFIKLFPEKGHAIHAYCWNQERSKDEKFKEAIKLGKAEIQKCMAGMGTLNALRDHIDQRYSGT